MVGRANSNPIPASQETSTSRLPGAKAASSSSETNINGASVSCSTQLTTMSCRARNVAVDDGTVVGLDHGASWDRPSTRSMWSSTTEGIGDATAVTSRMVSTVTSWTPRACRAVIAPRAVFPKPMTTAVRWRP